MASPQRTAGTQTLASPPCILIRAALLLGTGVTCTVEGGAGSEPRTSSQRSLQWLLSLSEPRFPFLDNAVPLAPAFCDPPIGKPGSRSLSLLRIRYERDACTVRAEGKRLGRKEWSHVSPLPCPLSLPPWPAALVSDLLLLTASSSSAAARRNGTVPVASRSGPASVSSKHRSAQAGSTRSRGK